MTEKELDRVFSQRAAASPEFACWLLSQTGFADLAPGAVLLHEEQAQVRPQVAPCAWYRHWWCHLPDGKGSETDIFLVYGHQSASDRLALHIENKPPHGSFRLNQAENYAYRAKFMANQARFMNYQKWQTVLLAPLSFYNSNSRLCAVFDCFISYEEVSKYVPEFGIELQKAA